MSDGDLTVQLGGLAWRLRPLTATLTKVSLTQPRSGLTVKAEKATLDLDLSGWASGRVRVTSVELDKPRLDWTLGTGAESPEPEPVAGPTEFTWPVWLAGSRLEIRRAEAKVSQAGRKWCLTDFNADLNKGRLRIGGTVELTAAGSLNLAAPVNLTGTLSDRLGLDGRFRIETGAINGPGLAGRLNSSGRLIADRDRVELAETVVRLDLDRFDPAPADRIDLSLSGAWRRSGGRGGGRIELTDLSLTVPGLAELSGRLTVDPDRPDQPQGKLTGALTDLAVLSRWLGPDWLNRLRPAGRLPLSLTAAQSSGQVRLMARLDLDQIGFSPVSDGPERRLSGRLTATGPWQWPVPRKEAWTVTGQVGLTGLVRADLDLAWAPGPGLSGKINGQAIDLAAWAGLLNLDFPTPAGSLPFKLTAPADGSPWRCDLALDQLSLPRPGSKAPTALSGRLELTGPTPFGPAPRGPETDRQDYRLSGQVAADLGRIDGRVNLIRREAAWELGQYQVSGRIDRFRDWLDLIGLKPGRPWSGLDFSGPIPFDLAGRGTVLDRATVDLADLVVQAPGPGAKVKLTGRLIAAGSPSEPGRSAGLELSGDLKAEADWAGAGLKLTGTALEGQLSGFWPGRAVLSGRFKLPSGGLVYRDQPIDPGDLTGAFRLKADQAGDWSVRLADPAATGLGKLSGAVSLGPKGPSGRLAAEKLDLAGLMKLIDATTGSRIAAWSPGGSVKAAVEIKPGAKSPAWRAEAGLSQIGLASPDGRIMVQGGAGRLNLVAPTGAENFQLGLTLTNGQALWDTVFVDLAKNGLTAKASVGRIRPDRIDGLDFNLDFTPYGRIDFRGAALLRDKGPAPKGRLTLTNLDAARIYQAFVKDTLVAVRPDLGDFRPSGLVGADLDLVPGPKGCRLKGRLQINQAALAGLPGGGLDKISLDLPVDYLLGDQPANPVQPERWGWLEINGLTAGPITAQRLAGPIALVPNRLLVKGRLGVGIMGGRLRLADIEIDRPLSPDFRATAQAAWGGIDLGTLNHGGIPISGRLSGDLGRIELNRQSLTVSKPLTGELFGGVMTVTNLRLDRPFAPGRLFRTDATVRRLDLDQLSRALDFGRVTGRFDVEATDLRIAYGQAVGMNLIGRSVAVEGVSRSVSLKAVNSISVIGAGAGLEGLGVSIMKPFFQEFPYDKIGFSCTLKNDTFTVRGLIRENGVEYLVKKPLLTGINVVNANPDNRIGFKDMIRRLRRVIGNLNESEAK